MIFRLLDGKTSASPAGREACPLTASPIYFVTNEQVRCVNEQEDYG